MGLSALSRFPILRVIGGILLLLAGILAYYRISLGASGALIFLIGGAAVLLIAFVGHRPRPGDIAIFAVGLLVLTGVTTGYAPGPQLRTYSASKAQVHSEVISLDVTASVGSVDVRFTDNPNLAYQVNFTRSIPFLTVWPVGEESVRNSSSGGTFNLDVKSSSSAVTVLLGRGYPVDISVTADTGSISFETGGSEDIRSISLSSSTGSVSAIVDSTSLSSLIMRTSTGSVSLTSHLLGAGGPSVPVTLSTSTGSVSVTAGFQERDAVTLSAGTSLGSISHNLNGFVITQDTKTSLKATAGNPSSETGSFVVSATTNLGSVNVSASMLGF